MHMNNGGLCKLHNLWFWEASIDMTNKSSNLTLMKVDAINTFILLSPVSRVWF